MFKNPKLWLFYLSQSLASIYFWGVISVPYLLFRGLTNSQVFQLLSIYNLFGLVFEYPTGVIGDKFGYRKTLVAAGIICGLAMIFLAQNGNFLFYLSILCLLALGSGLFSGNDMGVLKSVSQNIKKDTAVYNSILDLVLFISAILAGFISTVSFQATLYVSATAIFCSSIPLYFLHATSHGKKKPLPVVTIIKHSVQALREDVLKHLFIVSVVFGGFLFVIKNVVGTFGALYNINIVTIGIIVGISGLLRSIGAEWYAMHLGKKLSWVTVGIAVFLIIAGISKVYAVVVGCAFVVQLCFGYFLAKIDGDVNEMASDEVRASIFSLKRLIIRFTAASFLFAYGFVSNLMSFGFFMIGSGIILMMSVIIGWGYVNGKYGGKKVETPILVPADAVIKN